MLDKGQNTNDDYKIQVSHSSTKNETITSDGIPYFFHAYKISRSHNANIILLSHITRKYISYISQKTHMRRRLVRIKRFSVHSPSSLDRL